ncbi:MAG: AAA family ATPase [Fibrobacterota bacterium]|nr:AAA family ATPase [Fibrobacterota bacterium]
MNIETLRVKNFKALQNIEITDLPAYCVFVGRNGTGKTTLFRVFAFLKNCLEKNVRTALNMEGGRNGLKEVLSRGHENEDLEIEIQFRLDIAGTNRLVTYRLEIGESPDKGVLVKREILRYKRGRHGSPFHFIDFTNGEGYAINNEEEFDKSDSELTREPQKLDSPETLAIKGLGQFERFKAASAFRQLIENWHISDFHINSARGDKEEEDAQHLSSSGDNLPSMARYLYEKHRDVFDSITKRMQERVPGVAEISVMVTEDGRLLMRYRDGAFADPFLDRNVSDGTIKMFAYLVLLADPKPHPILCVEEPENQLYPELMGILAEEFQQYAERGGQVFVSSHSPEFLNSVPLESIYWLEKENGETTVRKASDEPLLVKLVQEGDLPGYLWSQDLLNSKKLPKQ